MQRLINIQQKLKAPKSQKNTFGNYMYRNAEDILEAVKPILREEKVALIIGDEIVNIGSRFYVKATATIFDQEGKEIAHSSALAREEESKKGQDGSQVTGASSSYARKYALNGLFAIDDTKDSDTTNKGDKQEETTIKFTEPETPAADNDIDLIEGLKACDTLQNAIQYKNLHLHEVKDKTKFNSTFAQVCIEIKKKGNQNAA